MLWPKLTNLSSRSRWIIAGIPISFVVSTVILLLDRFVLKDILFRFDADGFSTVGQTALILCGVYQWFAIIYALTVGGCARRICNWAVATENKRLDVRWLRWIITIFAIASLAAAKLFATFPWLLLPTVTALGVALCVYFGHLIFFRLQCGLLEWMTMTTFFGLIDGLTLSTPGALEIGLYLSPLLAAWVMYGAVSGIVRAQLHGEDRPGARIAYMAAAWYCSAALAMLAVGGLIIGLGMYPQSGMAGYRICGWALLVAGGLGFALDVVLNIRTKRRARAILKDAVPVNESVLNPVARDVKPEAVS